MMKARRKVAIRTGLSFIAMLLSTVPQLSARAQFAGIASSALGEIQLAREPATVVSTIATDQDSNSSKNGIQYNGGSIIDDAPGVNVYFIWYGDWSGQTTARHVLLNF